MLPAVFAQLVAAITAKEFFKAVKSHVSGGEHADAAPVQHTPAPPAAPGDRGITN